jgi:hypothetical protein
MSIEIKYSHPLEAGDIQDIFDDYGYEVGSENNDEEGYYNNSEEDV